MLLRDLKITFFLLCKKDTVDIQAFLNVRLYLKTSKILIPNMVTPPIRVVTETK